MNLSYVLPIVQDWEMAWEDCTRCRLSTTRKQVVTYRGRIGAKVMLIGEAPGEDEDDKGEPFVGKAGRLLDDLLMMAGLDPELDVVIANVIGCRPPKNRTPEEDEVEACRPRLDNLIWTIHPQLLVLMGATALNNLASHIQGGISKNRGRLTQVELYTGEGGDMLRHSWPAILTYHPSFLLRTGKRLEDMNDMAADFRRAWTVATTGAG